MPGIGGIGIVDNLLSNAAQLNLGRNENALSASATRLSTGLRINTAADDPSGLAIAEKLQSRVNGFDQGGRNVQDATNALTVADGALQTITDIVQRVRTLSIEAASDVTSPGDRGNLQTEVNELLLEVNRISQNTAFNGIPLLDGPASIPTSPALVQPTIVQNATTSTVSTNLTFTLATPPVAGDLLIVGMTFDSWPGYSPPNVPTPPPGWNLVDEYYPASQNGGYALFSRSVQSGDPASYTWTFPYDDSMSGSIVELTNVDASNPIDAVGAQSVAGPVSTSTTPAVAATSAEDLGLAFTGIDAPASPTTPATTPGWSELSFEPNSFHELLTQTNTDVPVGTPITAGTAWNLSAADSGGIVVLINPLLLPRAPTLQDFGVQNGSDEGDRLPIMLPTVDAATLNVSGIDVTTFAGAESAIGTCDGALDSLDGIRAQIGAQMVALGEDQGNDDVASVNLQSSESTIRDLDVAQETTTFNRLQILVDVGTSVVTQANANPQSVLRLFP